MDDSLATRLSDGELHDFFDRLFPHGFAGAGVVAEIAPEGWEKSPLLACFHPSIEQVYQEGLQIHRNIEELTRGRHKRAFDNSTFAPQPEPTMEEIHAHWKEEPINLAKEVTDLVALCLWDVLSDNHEVIAADGRVADIGSFRGAAAFLSEYLTGPNDDIWNMDYCRFYMGTIWISQRADLTPVYRMIFRRLKTLGADWVHHFPEIVLVDLSPLRTAMSGEENYSPSEAFAAEEKEQGHQKELEKTRAEFAAINEAARRKAMDRPPPETVQAYTEVFGREPRGWPPC